MGPKVYNGTLGFMQGSEGGTGRLVHNLVYNYNHRNKKTSLLLHGLRSFNFHESIRLDL